MKHYKKTWNVNHFKSSTANADSITLLICWKFFKNVSLTERKWKFPKLPQEDIRGLISISPIIINGPVWNTFTPALESRSQLVYMQVLCLKGKGGMQLSLIITPTSFKDDCGYWVLNSICPSNTDLWTIMKYRWFSSFLLPHFSWIYKCTLQSGDGEWCDWRTKVINPD